MTIKDDAIAINQIRKTNIDYLELKMNSTYKTLLNLRILLDQQKAISLSDAIDLIEAGKTLDVIDNTNIKDKLLELDPAEPEIP